MKSLATGHCTLLLVVIGMATGVSRSAESPPAMPPPRLRAPSGPYCGINSVYASARHYRKSVSYGDLVAPRFVGSYQGSNLAELVAAVDSVGLAATPKAGMTVHDLRSLNYPSILLLSRHRDSVAFHHWVLVLHAGADRIRVMESPGSSESLSYAQLLAQWDGVALVVYPDSSAKSATDNDRAAWKWALAVLASAAALGLYADRHWLPASVRTAEFQPRRALLRAGAIIGLGTASALLWHGFAPTGFARNAQAIAIVKARFFSRNLPHVSREQLVELIKSNHTILVDARYEADYRFSHIPSAINIPVHISPTALQELAQEIPAGKQVVVYCQSDKCEYDDQIGSQLKLMGIKNVVLYHGGWKDWKAWQRRSETATTLPSKSRSLNPHPIPLPKGEGVSQP